MRTTKQVLLAIARNRNELTAAKLQLELDNMLSAAMRRSRLSPVPVRVQENNWDNQGASGQGDG